MDGESHQSLRMEVIDKLVSGEGAGTLLLLIKDLLPPLEGLRERIIREAGVQLDALSNEPIAG